MVLRARMLIITAEPKISGEVNFGTEGNWGGGEWGGGKSVWRVLKEVLRLQIRRFKRRETVNLCLRRTENEFDKCKY